MLIIDKVTYKVYCVYRMAPRYELAVGLNKGHKTTKIRVAKNKSEKKKTVCLRPSRIKGVGILHLLHCIFTLIVISHVFLQSIRYVIIS